MPHRVVERFELIQINEQQGTLMPAARADGLPLLQPIHQQPPVGQPGERVIEGQVADLFFRLFGLGGIGEGRNIVRGLPIRAFHRRDGLPFRINFAVLAAIPDLARPSAGIQQLPPHIGIKFLVVPPGFEQRRFLSHHFIRAVAGHVGESIIDADDGAAYVSHHDTVQRLEGGGGDAYFLFHQPLLRDIADDPDELRQLPLGIVNRRDGQLVPERRPVLAVVHQGAGESFAMQQGGAQFFQCLRVGLRAVHEGGFQPQHFRLAIAADALEGGIGIGDAPLRVGDQHTLRNRTHGLVMHTQNRIALERFFGLHHFEQVSLEHYSGTRQRADFITAPTFLEVHFDIPGTTRGSQRADGLGCPFQRKNDAARNGCCQPHGKREQNRRKRANQ